MFWLLLYAYFSSFSSPATFDVIGSVAYAIEQPTLTPTLTVTPTATLTPTPTATPTPVILPMSVSIPSLSLDQAALEYLSVDELGAMQTPMNPMNAGWLTLGPKPGENGTAVLNGHLDDVYGNAAVFAKLRYIQPGQEVVLHMQDGSQRVFVVESLGELDAYTGDIQDAIRQTQYPSLNLITCYGYWDARNGIYSKRLIVFTRLKE